MTQYPFVSGRMNFVPAGVRDPKSIYTSNVGRSGINYTPDNREVLVANGRLREDSYSLDRNGFSLIHRETALGPVTHNDDPSIEKLYYPEVRDILIRETGAQSVVIFDHTIRISGNTQGREPVLTVHNDYTDISGPRRLADTLGAETAAEWLQGRVAQVNLWRPLAGPVQSLPLALIDAQSIAPTDLRRVPLVFNDRTGEIFHVGYNAAQKWVYFPEMQTDEAILIKGYDSATDGRARFTPHTAFELPGEAGGIRHSIEVRAFLRLNA